MKRYRNLLIAILFILSLQGFGQSDTLTLAFCHEAALSVSPLSQQEGLIAQKNQLQYDAAGKSNLPIIDIAGKATYQSEVIEIPGTSQFPDYPVIPKEQFNLYLDVKQKIYDGSITSATRDIIMAENEVANNQLDVDLNLVKTKVNQYYFAGLLSQENENIFTNIKKTLETQRAVTESAVKNGILLETSLLSIDKEILTIDQQILQAKSEKIAHMKMLAAWIGRETIESSYLALPTYDIRQIDGINRPELSLINSQKEVIHTSSNMLAASRMPRLYAFGQGGLGQPNPVNFFEVDPSTYYIVGLQLSWNVFDWGKTRMNLQSAEIQQQILDTRYKDIEHEINITLIRLYEKEKELIQMLEKDDEIISLQNKILEITESQIYNGVRKLSDYLTELNSLTDALLKKKIHDVALSQTRAEVLTLTGNL